MALIFLFFLLEIDRMCNAYKYKNINIIYYFISRVKKKINLYNTIYPTLQQQMTIASYSF